MTASAVKGNGQPGPDKAQLEKLPKAKLIAMILKQRMRLIIYPYR